MKNSTRNGIMFWIVIILSIGIIFILAHWIDPSFEEGCLEERALNYCIQENFEGLKYVSGPNNVFICYSQIGTEREGFKNETKRFYFTQKEVDECLTKERHSFGGN